MSLIDYIVNEALILIPALNIIGLIIKNVQKIPDKYIPIILLVFGIGGCIGIMGFSASSIIQGVLITGTAVYGNQIIKQLKESD